MSEQFDEKLNELMAESIRNIPHEETSPGVAVGFKRLSDDAFLPTKAHATDSGFDLYASEDVIIKPGETAVVPTGIAVKLPAGYEATVRPRSGVTSRTKLRVQLGTIDNGYGGEIGIIVDSTNSFTQTTKVTPLNYVGIDGKESDEEAVIYGSYIVRKGDKLAQLVVQPIPNVESYEITGDIGDTDRGDAGFGSTGVREDN